MGFLLGGGLLGPTGSREEVSPLLTGLRGAWKCDEASGALLDVSGFGNHPTAVNSPGSAAGKVGLGRGLVRASSQYFTLAENANFVMGNVSWQLTGWFKPNSVVAQNVLPFAKNHNEVGQKAFHVRVRSSGGGIDGFFVDTAGNNFTADALEVPTTTVGVWYFCSLRYDDATKTGALRVNNGTRYTVGGIGAGGIGTGNAIFSVGATGIGNNLCDGVVDAITWHYGRILTDAEEDLLWNGGAGREWPFT